MFYIFIYIFSRISVAIFKVISWNTTKFYLMNLCNFSLMIKQLLHQWAHNCRSLPWELILLILKICKTIILTTVSLFIYFCILRVGGKTLSFSHYLRGEMIFFFALSKWVLQMKPHTFLKDMSFTDIFYSYNFKSVRCDFKVLQDNGFCGRG